MINLDMLRQEQDVTEYNLPPQALAVLLEGTFVSLFLNRVPPEIMDAPEIGFIDKSKPTSMIVIADGDIIKNQVQAGESGPTYLPCGYDRFTRQQFGNRDLVLNAMNYLCDDSGLLAVRSRELKLRVLDSARVKASELQWQLINTAGPVILVLLFGIAQFLYRKNRYTRLR